MSESKQETKQETKEETKEETRETRSEAVLNREHANIIQYLMTNPETGERWSYAESRERYG